MGFTKEMADGLLIGRAVRAETGVATACSADAYDEWFRAEIAAAIAEADDPNTKWITNEEVQASWKKKRAELLKRAGFADEN